MDLPDSDQGAQWFSQTGLRAIHANKPTLSFMLQLSWCGQCLENALLPLALCGPAAPCAATECGLLTWPCSDLAGAESPRETNPRRQGELLPVGSAPVLEDPGLIWPPAPGRKEDTSNSWGWSWGGGPFILAMVCLRCDVRLCSKATWVHPCHLLTSEEDLAVTG